MVKLSREEYEILFHISKGKNNVDKLEGMFEKKSLMKTIRKFQQFGLIRVDYWKEELFGFMETLEGIKLLGNKEYEDWRNACAD
jgi:hypothetical protein